MTVLNPYFDIITTTLDGRLPIDAIGPNLPGWRKKCVFICQRERAEEITSASPPRPFDAYVARLLELEEILAYTIDWRGRRRFARALLGKLMSTTS